MDYEGAIDKLFRNCLPTIKTIKDNKESTRYCVKIILTSKSNKEVALEERSNLFVYLIIDQCLLFHLFSQFDGVICIYDAT